MADLIGAGREFVATECPTYRAVIRRGLLLQELRLVEKDVAKHQYRVRQIATELCPLVLAQWRRSNAKFSPPVLIREASVIRKIEQFWERAREAAKGVGKQTRRQYVLDRLDRLFDLTNCRHTIFLCRDQGSGCSSPQECSARAHIHCDCPRDQKIPTLELEWLYHKRAKVGEESSMRMAGVDQVETLRQINADKRKRAEEEARLKRQKKEEEEKSRLQQLEDEERTRHQQDASEEVEMEEEEEAYSLSLRERRRMEKETRLLVEWLLKSRLGKHVSLVLRYLDQPAVKRNMMAVQNLAAASLRFDVTPSAAAALATGFLQDLIAGGHLSPDLAYLACDPAKVRRARQKAMRLARDMDEEKHHGVKIAGLGYDGRKDPNTRAMVSDSHGKLHLRRIKEEHVTVTEEPGGRYLWHFVPDDPVYPEKPALKVAQALYDLVSYDSLESLQVLQGDSTAINTGWKAGTHALLEKMLGRKLFWSICMLHTNELPLRHLITTMDGPTSSGTGFTGPVGRLLKKVNEMEYDPEFVALPGGEELIEIPDSVLVTMSTDQQMSYRLVKAVKSGVLPPELQEIQCGTISHARWLTTAQSLVFMWTRKHGLTGQDLTTLEVLAKYCIEMYFKMYFDIKIQHRLLDGPRHILTQLRILRSQPKEVRDAVTFYVRTGAWYAHPECVLLSLVSSESEDDRRFAVSQILKLRGDREFGDTEVRPRITPKLNLTATTLQELISWQPGQVQEPVFTCSLTREEIKMIVEKPYEVPGFSIHTQITERAVKQVTEAAAAVVG